MADNKRPLLADLKDEIGSLDTDLREMARLRWELANLELRAAVETVKRLAIMLAAVAITALSALPLLAVAFAQLLDGWLSISFAGWLLIFGFGLLIGSGVFGYLAWRHFCRRFTGMEQTLEEFREDLVWLKQWIAPGTQR